MKKTIIYIIFIICSLPLFSQNDEGVKQIITMDGKDTLVIKEYNCDKKLTFHKIFPQYGVSQILAYTYDANQLKSYTWSHSNIGFIEFVYEYDSLKNIIKTFSYKQNKNTSIPNLMNYYSVASLKNSSTFKAYKVTINKFLASIQYLENSLVTKEIEYNPDMSIKYTTYFVYDEGLLKQKKQVYGHNNAYNEIIYTYDKRGNEVQWLKRFGSSDTSIFDKKIEALLEKIVLGSTKDTIIYNKKYENNLLKEVIGFENGKKSSSEFYNYSGEKLISRTLYDSDNKLKISFQYHYNKNNTINYIYEVNNYIGQEKISYYYYFQ